MADGRGPIADCSLNRLSNLISFEKVRPNGSRNQRFRAQKKICAWDRVRLQKRRHRGFKPPTLPDLTGLARGVSPQSRASVACARVSQPASHAGACGLRRRKGRGARQARLSLMRIKPQRFGASMSRKNEP
jgi:hypothetical protein